MATADDEQVPRIPRGRGLRLSWPQMIRIVMTIGLLVVLIAMQKPCSQAVGKFVTSFDGSGSAGSAGSGAAMAKPGTIDVPTAGSASANGSGGIPGAKYVHLQAGMTDEQMKAEIDRARAAPTVMPEPQPKLDPQPNPQPQPNLQPQPNPQPQSNLQPKSQP